MKLPITDKFLWMLYNFLEELDRAFDVVAPRTMKEVVCPDFFKLKREWERKESRKNFSRLIYYLKKKGLIKIENLKAKKGIILSKKGEKKILKIKYKMIKKKRRKDGKFIMLIFDIPERKRSLRNLLREHLHLLGYKILQQSVWICPYDVLKETEEFLRIYSLDTYVKIFLIEEMEI